MRQPLVAHESEASVIARAIEAYVFAKHRARLQKSGSLADREEVRRLPKQYPEYYTVRGESGTVRFTGQSADSILEDHLRAETRGGRGWLRLAGIVVKRGETVFAERPKERYGITTER